MLLGNGDGTFQETSDPNIGDSPGTSVAVGDFNHDGNADLAVSGFGHFFQGFVSVLLGQGNGTFQAPQKLLVSDVPGPMAVADFNRDGNLDIVTANDTNNFPNPGTVSVFLGNGQGGFPSVLNFSSGVVFASGMAVGDFNRDGFPDVAITDDSFNTAASNTVAVLINSGSWPALTITATPATPALTPTASPAAVAGPATPLPADPNLMVFQAQLPGTAMLGGDDVAVLDRLFASPDWWGEPTGLSADPLGLAYLSRFGRLG